MSVPTISTQHQTPRHHAFRAQQAIDALQGYLARIAPGPLVNTVVADSALLAAMDSGLPAGTTVTVQVSIDTQTGKVSAIVNPGAQLLPDAPHHVVRTVRVVVPERPNPTRVRPTRTRKVRIEFDGRDHDVEARELPADRDTGRIASGDLAHV